MTPDRVSRSPDGVAVARSGRVLTVDTGLVRVRTRGGTVRASVGSDLLARMARDPGAAPRRGDRVGLLVWADGRVTVERVVVRAMGERPTP